MSEKWVCCECGDVVSDMTEHLQAHGVMVGSDEYHDLLAQCAQVKPIDLSRYFVDFNSDKGDLVAALASHLEYVDYLRQLLAKGVQV
ncbi:MAG: hypothetical protein WHX52_18505 [Anaerolineae bacterium]